jgi:hypothetical protein
MLKRRWRSNGQLLRLKAEARKAHVTKGFNPREGVKQDFKQG